MFRVLGPIGHCSAKVRNALAIDEEEALRWNVRIVRTPDRDQRKRGGGRFNIAASFDVPGPFASRPVSSAGRVSFHFAEQTVTKLANGGSLITSAKGQKSLPANATAKHDAYVARPEAVLTVSAADFGNYAERPSAVEMEAEQAAIFSNISDDPEQRYRFWRAVHQHERSGKPSRLVLHRERLSVDGWRSLSQAEQLPLSVREAAAKMLDLPMGKMKKNGNATVEMDASQARELRVVMKAICAREWDEKKPPVRVAVGRNGRTQFRLTAEFPIGLDAAARVRITRRFCEEFEKLGAMYTAAIHAPDAHNDERNHHLHLAYYDRPCAIVAGTGKWDFEIHEKVAGQFNRYTYPLRQPKIAELGRDPHGGGYAGYRASIIYRWRELFAELCNQELEAVGIARRFDPRRYNQMGIDQEPTKPLGPNAAPLEAAGVPTVAGCKNAEIIWSAQLNMARKADDERRAVRKKKLDRARQVAEQVGDGQQGDLSTKVEELANLDALLSAHELEIEEFGIMLEMAYARPQKTFDTCSQLLSVLEEGKGTRSDRANMRLVANRKASAEDFLGVIDTIQEECMARIEPILKAVESARHRFSVLSEDLDVLSMRENSPAIVQPQAKAEEKSGNKESRHASIDAILDRIAAQNLCVLEPDQRSAFYRVPGLSRDEFRLLSSDRAQSWVQQRLARIAEIQKMRMTAAAQAINKLGRAELERLAPTSSDLRRALVWVDAYANHPTFQELTCSMPDTQAQPPHIERNLEPADAMKQPQAEVAARVSPWEASPMHQPTDYAVPDGREKQERDAAIRAYVAALLTEPQIKILTVESELRVDRSSIPDWSLSAASFEDEPLVKQAILERQASNLDRERARDRYEIILELGQATERPLERSGDRWAVNHISERFRQAANDWQDHPELAEAYERLDRLWTGREIYGSPFRRADMGPHKDAPNRAELRASAQTKQGHENDDHALALQAAFLENRGHRAR